MRIPRPHVIADYARESLWLLPSASVAGAVALGLVVTNLRGGPHLYEGSASDARAILAVVAGAVITVAGTVFSLTVVALEMAASNYSPRLLRNFLADRHTQVSLSVLVATFAYILTLLRGLPAEAPTPELPQMALALAAAATLGSLFTIIYYLHHISQSIRIESILLHVERTTLATIRRTNLTDMETTRLPEPPAGAAKVPAAASGYVQSLDLGELIRDCSSLGVTVRLEACIGDHIVEGTTLAWAWSTDGELPDDRELRHLINADVEISFERTLSQDVSFGIRQLVDIAIRAISPAVNDPTTATEAIRHLAVVLTSLAQRPCGPRVGRDDEGRERVFIPTPSFSDYLQQALAQIRRYGAGEPEVLRALLHTLTDVASVCDDGGRRAAVLGQVDLIMTAAQEIRHPADREVVAAAAAQVRAAAAGQLDEHVAGEGP